MKVTTIGIDLAKNVFALSAADERGKVLQRARLGRGHLLPYLRELRPCVVGMEACGGAHHLARAIGALGYEVRLMCPALVRPYRRGFKHDRNDADAICEAVRHPEMRYVAVKSVAQQDKLALHRVRFQKTFFDGTKLPMVRDASPSQQIVEFAHFWLYDLDGNCAVADDIRQMILSTTVGAASFPSATTSEVCSNGVPRPS